MAEMAGIERQKTQARMIQAPSMLRMVFAGFGRYRKTRKNLSAALSFIFFLILFFVSLFSALGRNLEAYWVDSVLGGDYAVSRAESYVDIMKPVNPDNYFDPVAFYVRNPRAKAVSSPRLRVGVMAEAGDGDFENMFILVGLDPVREKELFDSIQLEAGSYFSGTKAEIILPPSIMGALGVSLGGDVVLAAQTSMGFLNMERARVVGVRKDSSTSFIFGNYQGFAPLELVRSLVGTELASEILIQPGALGNFSGLRGPFRLSPAIESFGIARAVSLAYGFLRLMILLLLGAFALGIVYQNLSLMNEERRAEIGLYLSYGASPSWVATLMYGELSLYILYCALLGGSLAVAALGGLSLAGLYPIDTVTEVMLGGKRLSLWPGPEALISSFALFMSVVFASSSLPIWKAVLNQNIVSMFRKV